MRRNGGKYKERCKVCLSVKDLRELTKSWKERCKHDGRVERTTVGLREGETAFPTEDYNRLLASINWDV